MNCHDDDQKNDDFLLYDIHAKDNSAVIGKIVFWAIIVFLFGSVIFQFIAMPDLLDRKF